MVTTSNEQAAGQHYLVCGIHDCRKNGQLYCNDFQVPMCEQSKDEHRKSPNKKTMTLSSTDNEKTGFLLRNANYIQRKT